MSPDLTLFALVSEASLLVKLVMAVLLLASVASWHIIFKKRIALTRASRAATAFEDVFWSGKDLVSIYNRINAPKYNTSAMERIFQSGFRESAKLRGQSGIDGRLLLEGTHRAMRVAVVRELDELDTQLPFLATVGSVSPYIGLFGTVWGIMNSFRGLANVHQATLAMVAPGISEALVATAMGLFAAIPAVIAYNRYATDVDRLTTRYETFVDEFSSILQRQASA